MMMEESEESPQSSFTTHKTTTDLERTDHDQGLAVLSSTETSSTGIHPTAYGNDHQERTWDTPPSSPLSTLVTNQPLASRPKATPSVSTIESSVNRKSLSPTDNAPPSPDSFQSVDLEESPVDSKATASKPKLPLPTTRHSLTPQTLQVADSNFPSSNSMRFSLQAPLTSADAYGSKFGKPDKATTSTPTKPTMPTSTASTPSNHGTSNSVLSQSIQTNIPSRVFSAEYPRPTMGATERIESPKSLNRPKATTFTSQIRYSQHSLDIQMRSLALELSNPVQTLRNDGSLSPWDAADLLTDADAVLHIRSMLKDKSWHRDVMRLGVSFLSRAMAYPTGSQERELAIRDALDYFKVLLALASASPTRARKFVQTLSGGWYKKVLDISCLMRFIGN
jgi:hypothetical protein